jgi:hypothetical protein
MLQLLAQALWFGKKLKNKKFNYARNPLIIFKKLILVLKL